MKHTADIRSINLTRWDCQSAFSPYVPGSITSGPFQPSRPNQNHCESVLTASDSSSTPTADDDHKTLIRHSTDDSGTNRAKLWEHGADDSASSTLPNPRSTSSLQNCNPSRDKNISTRAQRRSLARDKKKLAKKKHSDVQAVAPAICFGDRNLCATEGSVTHSDGQTEDKSHDLDPEATADKPCSGIHEKPKNVLIGSGVDVIDGTKHEHNMDGGSLGNREPGNVAVKDEHIAEVPVEGSSNVLESAAERFLRRLQEFSLQPRTLTAKFRCPKEKKPGDDMTIRHPLYEDRFVDIVIPPYAKSGRVFYMELPIPLEMKLSACVICDDILPEAGDYDESLRAPLRVCEHVCCQQCHEILCGRFCPACESPLPALKTLEMLPLIQHLDNSLPVREALLEEYFLSKEHDSDPSNKDIVKKREAAAQNSVRTIDKHYRRASIKFHPDRFGDAFRKEFDELTKAKDILRDALLRESYLDSMISIACRVDVGYIPYSHSMWMEKNDPDKKDQVRPDAQADTRKKNSNMQLEGGLMNCSPRKPLVVKATRKQISVCMPVQNADQFVQYCQQVTVYGTCSNMDAAEVVLAVIPKAKLEIFEGEIRVSLNVPVQGIWDIFWNFNVSFDEGKSIHETPRSACSHVDLRSKEEKSLPAQVDGLVAQVKDLTSKLQIEVGSPVPTGRLRILRCYNRLHHGIVKGVNLRTKLRAAVSDAKDASWRFMANLEDILKAATEEQKHIERILKQYDKKDTRKQFGGAVAHNLKSSGAQEWIASITPGELAEMGGDPNRLYQLLIESKRVHGLARSESILLAAGKREDLFTEKQRDALKDRVLVLSDAHLDDFKQVQGRKKIEGIRNQSENTTRALDLSCGTRVFLHDLKARTDLNGAQAVYLGVHAGLDDRYVVKLDRDGQEIAIKKENFDVWDFQSKNEIGFSLAGRENDSSSSKDDAQEAVEGEGRDCRHKFVREVDVDFNTVGRVVGKNHKNLIQIMKTTGTKIKICKEKYSIGTVTFKVSSELKTSVDEAAVRIVQAAASDRIPSSGITQVPESPVHVSFVQDAPATYPTVTHPASNFPEASSISSALTGDDDIVLGLRTPGHTGSGMIGGTPLLGGVIEPYFWDSTAPPLLSPTFSLSVSPATIPSVSQSSLESSMEREGLLNFLSNHRDCIKVSPNDFFDWLSTQDILSLADLRDACEDDDFVSEDMREAGLKGFKKNAFVKAVLSLSQKQ